MAGQNSIERHNAASRRNFIKLGAASALSLAWAPRRLFADKGADGRKIALRCAVMSDVHFNGKADAKEVGRFQRALRFMYDYSAKHDRYNRFDALVVVGDMSNNGVPEQLNLFKETMDAEIHGETKTFLCMGNHEFYGGDHDVWSGIFGVKPNAVYEANGYRFIAVSPEKGTMADGDYVYAREWLEGELAAAYAADPTKPIFVFQHYPITPTVYGGRGLDDYGAEDLFDTLQKYPTAVDFSGHTHYPLTDPRVAWQGNFTAFGTSTLSYVCHGGEGGRNERHPSNMGDYAEFYVMEVYEDNSITLMPYDAAKNSFYDFVYVVGKPGDLSSYVYTDARFFTAERPRWSDGASASVAETHESGAVVRIPQAECRDVVHSYRVDLERRADDGSWTTEPPQFVSSFYYDHPAPTVVDANIDGLEPLTNYRAKIVALNVYGRESETSLDVAFATTADPNDAADRRAPRPDANFLDLRVVDGKIVNQPVNASALQKTPEIFGAPRIVHDDERGVDVAEFVNDGTFAKLQCNTEDYKRLRRATIAVRFRAASGRSNGVGSMFSNTEQRGVALSVNYEEKALKFWASVGSKPYTIAAVPIEFDRWYDAFGVYDGKAQILYLDGKEVARIDNVGALSFPTKQIVQAFGFGGDIAPGGKGSDFFSGRIERARVFTWALTPEQVAALSER